MTTTDTLHPDLHTNAAAPQILISLSSYGMAETRRHGQLWFARLALRAGADAVEIRGELLVDPARELPALADALQGKALVYSSPEGLWRDDASLDAEALDRAVAAATQLGSPRLKMSIGGFGPASLASLKTLGSRLAGAPCALVIENDQTAGAGTVGALHRFFDAADAAGIALPMTFDMGNWHWTGECPLDAARAFAPRVGYVHCKGVQRQPQRWVAVPLAESAAPWRSVLRALPPEQPWAIEYPLVGDDLLAVTQREVAQLRALAGAPL